ncbi:hypothetical protein AKO1_001229 [Acrasis kona]|uniref:NAD-dependent epimerase/dehydratase domain-containing protein n=1 Tax=Acrasis kona TaxID=1008807 RepID=A0AAW2ZCH1_9EUKA
MPSVFIAGSTGYLGNGISRAFRRAGYSVYGLIRDEKRVNELAKQEIIPVVGTIDNTTPYEHILLNCSVVVDAVGYGPTAEPFFEKVAQISEERNKNSGDIYNILYIFTSGIMTYGNVSKNPLDETVKPNPTLDKIKAREAFENKVLLHGKGHPLRTLRTAVVRPGFAFGGNGGAVMELYFNINKNRRSCC